jgi:hypothetical protein
MLASLFSPSGEAANEVSNRECAVLLLLGRGSFALERGCFRRSIADRIRSSQIALWIM